MAAFCVGGLNVVDLVNGQAGTKVGSPVAVTGQNYLGNAISGAGSSNYFTFAGRSTANDGRITLGGVFTPNSAVLQNPLCTTTAAASQGWSLGVTTAGVLQLVRGGTSTSAGQTLTIGQPYFAAASIDIATGILNYVAKNLATGVITTSVKTGQIPTPTAPSGTYGFGKEGNAGNNGSIIAAAFIAAQYHSLGELMTWALDPWGVFRQPDNFFLGPFAATTRGLFQTATLNGLSSGGSFFANPLG